MNAQTTTISYKSHLVIWAWLIALLIGGTFLSHLPLAEGELATLILGISLIKATLVGLFFMHLKFERVVPIWVVAIFPFFLIGLSVLLLVPGILAG
ncbi:MAG: hypothetical protein COV76_00210 [Candidatus Omnitrophica bacterium CG11_big_fil_rev_8_21_14_0_20_64_10]|nr:MAG: hypothetical protein COV76_00210 [Candidatus Omnitrophica bacterium CG11_big_fil_rev_8_21_14_0_20_64_10]